jgi:hypothetical protein
MTNKTLPTVAEFQRGKLNLAVLEAFTSGSESVTTPTGTVHKSLTQYENEIKQKSDAAVANVGYQSKGAYSNNPIIENINETVYYDGYDYRLRDGVARPYSINSTSYPSPSDDANLQMVKRRDQVNGLSQLKDFSPEAGYSVYLSDGNRSGSWEWVVGDFTDKVALDTLNGMYCPWDGDPTGATGCRVRCTNGEISLSAFGVDEFGSTSIHEALNIALSLGLKVNGKPGASYLMTDGVSVDDVSVDFNLNGSEIIQYGDFTPITATVNYLSEQDVTSITTESIDLLNGDAGSTTTTHVLNVSDSSEYQVNDFVKVVSDDLLPETDPADNQRLGEFAMVSKVDTGKIYLYSYLREEYATNIRVAKVNKDISVKVYNGVMNCDYSDNPLYNQPLLTILGAFEPLVSLKSERARSELVEFISCLSPRTYQMSGSSQVTSIANYAYGYTIIEYSCEGGKHLDPSGYNVRHVYTTGSKGSASEKGNMFYYGRTRDFKVLNLFGFNCQNSAADTHPDAEGGVFDGAVVRQPYNGPAGTQRNFQLRGKGTVIANSKSIGGTGYHIFMEYGVDGAARGNRLYNCTHDHLVVNQPTRYGYSILGQSGYKVLDTKIINPGFKSPGGKFPVVYAKNAEVIIENPDFQSLLIGSGDSRVFETDNAKIKVIGGEIDLSGSTDANLRVAQLSNDDDVELDGTYIKTDFDYFIARFGGANGRFVANIKSNHTFKKYSASYPYGLTNLGTSNTYLLNIETDRNLSTNFNHFTDSYSAAGDKTIDLAGRGGPHILCAIISLATSSTYLTDISAGYFLGQRITVYLDSTSGGAITVSAGNYIGLSADVALSVGASISFIWNGAKWLPC